jgi:hypothetical protein
MISSTSPRASRRAPQANLVRRYQRLLRAASASAAGASARTRHASADRRRRTTSG